MSRPRVSCVLATGNRLSFTRQAIRYFLRQTLDDSELIVVDDGAEAAEDLCGGLCRVTYVRLTAPTLLGTKLNIGVERSQGRVIQKLDDDDYYHPEFLERAVAALPTDESTCALVAWDCFLVLLAGDPNVRFSGHGWAAGGTLCFHRRLWERRGFRDIAKHVDSAFIEDHGPRVVRVRAPEQYMLVRHGANTWNSLSNGTDVDVYFRRLPVDHRSLADVVEPIDLPFYEALTRTRVA
jgi:glycosyltransferase involved in cell wall biosynthesis